MFIYKHRKNSGGSITTRVSIRQFSLCKLVSITVVQVSLSSVCLGDDVRSRKEKRERTMMNSSLVS